VATPYITPDILINAPTGISWETIPNYDSTADEQYAEQTNICWRTTSFIDDYCNQPLRATIDSEEVLGPDFRVTVSEQGLVRFVPSRWPVTAVNAAQYTASWVVPPIWNPIPTNGMYVENQSIVGGGVSTVAAAGPSSILITPGYVSWINGRKGFRLQVTYTNGYAHAGLVGSCLANATTLSLDDCTGMAGSVVTIYDGANTETVNVTATSVTQGPGTATLATGTKYAHVATPARPLIISAIPSAVQQAAIFYATYAALTRGATATTVQMMPGLNSGGTGAGTLLQDAKDLLIPFRRVF
jgi:hypothetical protein